MHIFVQFATILLSRVRRSDYLKNGLFILSVLAASFLLVLHSDAKAATIRTDSGLSDNTLAPNDDGSTGAVNLGFTINYLGTSRTQTFVNNNGNITFGSALSTFTPSAIGSASLDIIAPLWSDVDTDPFGDPVTYGTATINGRAAFAANYVNVDYYSSNAAHGTQLNDYQVVLFNRADVNAGDFDIEFNYENVLWETGNANGGAGGLGGTSARAGFGNTANTHSFEIPGAGTAGAYLNTNASTGLANTSNIGVTGRRYFLVRGGKPIVPGRDDMALVASHDAQRPVAAALDQHLISSTGDMGRALGQLYTLSTDGEKRVALNQLHPVVNGDVARASFAAMNQAIKTIMSYLDNARSGMGTGQTGVASGDGFQNVGVWIKGFGNFSEQETRGGVSGYDASAYGTLVGLDWPVNDRTRRGFSGGVARSDVDSKDQFSGSDIDSYQAALYESVEGGHFYIDKVISFAWNEYDATRKIDFGNIKRVADAGYSGQQYSAYVGGGYPIKDGKNLITPVASLQYVHLDLADYTETGADDLNLTVGDEHYDILQSGLGVKFSRPFKDARGTFIPQTHLMWLYDFVGDRIETTATFTGGGGSFETKGIKPSQSSLNLGLELTWITKGNLTVVGGYDYEWRSDFHAHSGVLTARFSF